MNTPTLLFPSVADKGFTLVELLVVLALSVSLLAGLVKLMLGYQQTAQHVNDIAQYQDDLRSMQVFLTQAINGANAWGCVGSRESLHVSSSHYDRFVSAPSQWFGVDVFNEQGMLQADGQFGSMVRFTGSRTKSMFVGLPSLAQGATHITIAHDGYWSHNDFVLISDCYGAEIRHVRRATRTRLQLDSPLSQSYEHGLRLAKPFATLYKIDQDRLQQVDWVRHRTQTMLNNIQNMQISWQPSGTLQITATIHQRQVSWQMRLASFTQP